MKNSFFDHTRGSFKVALFLGLFSSVWFSTYEPQKKSAEVEQMQGCYIFVDSKPVMEYEYLGTVSALVGWSSQYQSIRDQLLRKAKKEYPNADGLIFHFNAGGADKCDAIKFKE